MCNPFDKLCGLSGIGLKYILLWSEPYPPIATEMENNDIKIPPPRQSCDIEKCLILPVSISDWLNFK